MTSRRNGTTGYVPGSVVAIQTGAPNGQPQSRTNAVCIDNAAMSRAQAAQIADALEATGHGGMGAHEARPPPPPALSPNHDHPDARRLITPNIQAREFFASLLEVRRPTARLFFLLP